MYFARIGLAPVMVVMLGAASLTSAADDNSLLAKIQKIAEGLETLGRARYAPRADVLAGRLGPHLDSLLALRTAWTDQPLDGAERVADALGLTLVG